jgi:putative acetyltransferase
MMIHLLRTNSENQDFVQLVTLLDQDLQRRDGDDHPFFAQFNKIDSINYVVVAYLDLTPVGCGAIKQYYDLTMEVKRMFVTPEHRGNGVATTVLKELEQWTKELGYKKCILETGERQPEAIGLYAKNGYKRIPNYGQYANVITSVCFLKELD